MFFRFHVFHNITPVLFLFGLPQHTAEKKMRTKRCSARTVVGDGSASSIIVHLVAHYYSSTMLSFLLLLLVPTTIVLRQHPASSSSCLAMSLSSSFHGTRVTTKASW